MPNNYYFLNISNNPSSKWSTDQLDSAKSYGNVVDIPFPQIPPTTESAEIKKMAKSIASDICGTYQIGDVALVQGEMTFTYVLVHELQARGIVCFAACSDRVTEEVVNTDGTTTKQSIFKFVQFREYPTF